METIDSISRNVKFKAHKAKKYNLFITKEKIKKKSKNGYGDFAFFKDNFGFGILYEAIFRNPYVAEVQIQWQEFKFKDYDLMVNYFINNIAFDCSGNNIGIKALSGKNKDKTFINNDFRLKK